MALLKDLVDETLGKLKNYHFEDVDISAEQKKLIAQSIVRGNVTIKDNSFLIETSPNHFVIMPFQYISLAKICFPLACQLKESFDFIFSEIEPVAAKDLIDLQKEHGKCSDYPLLWNIIKGLDGEKKENVSFLIEDTNYNKGFSNTNRNAFRSKTDLLSAFILNVVPLTTASNSFFGDFIAGLTEKKEIYSKILDSIVIKDDTLDLNKCNFFMEIPLITELATENKAKLLGQRLAEEKKMNGSYAIHYFGLKYGKFITENNISPKTIIDAAFEADPSFGSSHYDTELSKGIGIYRLARKDGFEKISLEAGSNLGINEQEEKKDEPTVQSKSNTSKYKQIIYYGVPGSGKSHTIDEEVKGVPDDQKMRVVFHPEYSNADFVGQILPKIDDGIDYRFKAGPFSRILKKSLKNLGKPYYLIIEEINRGNAAAIFGELFQLLDRDKNGWSQYVIDNIDINAFIRSDDDTYTDKNSEIKSEVEFGGLKFNANSGIKLPPNLSILATMNTSDQNVFTLDNAFQRRWKMKLVENKFGEDGKAQEEALIADGKVTWGIFQEHINALIGEKTTSIGMSSMEDKRLGCWFVKAENGNISKDVFAEKVLKYLWDDAFKFCRDEVFNIENKNTTLESIISRFKSEDADKCWNIFKDISFVGVTTEKDAD